MSKFQICKSVKQPFTLVMYFTLIKPYTSNMYRKYRKDIKIIAKSTNNVKGIWYEAKIKSRNAWNGKYGKSTLE